MSKKRRKPGPLKYRELIQKLSRFGVIAVPHRGKGSEVILIKPTEPGTLKGPQIPIKHHGEGGTIYLPVINAILRRFGISKDEFWED
jgi:hypothetical protein